MLKYYLNITILWPICQQRQVFTNRDQGEKKGTNFQQLALSQKAKDCLLNAVLGWVAN